MYVHKKDLRERHQMAFPPLGDEIVADIYFLLKLLYYL